jgi:opacity protein-like surface antigen
MRTLKLLVVALLVTLVSAYAADVTVSSGLANRYLAFGNGAVLSDHPAAQSDLSIAFQNGFYVDLWNSAPVGSFKTEGSDFRNELDYGVGYSTQIKGFNVDLGLTYFDEPTLLKLAVDDEWYAHLKIGHDITFDGPFGKEPITVFGTYENYKTTGGTAYEGGSLFGIGLSKSQESQNCTLNVSQTIVYDDGGFGLNEGFLIKWFAELNWKVTEHFSLVAPQVTFYLPLNSDNRPDPEAVIYAGAKYHF